MERMSMRPFDVSGLRPKGLALAYSLISIVLISVLLTSCGSPQIIDLDLGEYESKLVVECYLKPNKKSRLLLTESQSYFAEPSYPLVENATVTLSYDGKTDTLLFNAASFEFKGPKVTMHLNMDYILRVEDEFGRIVTAKTQFKPAIAIDSLNFFIDNRKKARVITNFTDPGDAKNHYRITITSDSSKKWNRFVPDALKNGGPYAVSSSYKFPNHDFVKVRLYHITQDHYLFYRTVSTAQNSAGSPISEPAQVVSNIEGGLGIFTTLNWVEDSLHIEF